VDHGVDREVARRLERPLVVREEVVSAPPPLDPGPGREIDAEVGVGEDEDTDDGRRQMSLPGLPESGEASPGHQALTCVPVVR
jgi:hypothetical protein